MARATASSLKDKLATFAEELKALRRWTSPTMARLPQPMRNELRYYVTEFASWEKWIRCYLAWLVDDQGDPALPDEYVCPEPPAPTVPEEPEGPGTPGGTIGPGGGGGPNPEPVYYPPIADAGGPYTTELGQVTAFDGSRTVDPDTPLGSLIFDWDFGDGTAHAIGAGLVTPTHQYGDPGEYLVRLTVRDPQNQVSGDTAPVTIWQQTLPVPPTIEIGGPYTVINCTPPCGTALPENYVTVTAAATWDVRWTETQMVFTWNWGDGTGDQVGGRVNQHVYQLNGTIPPGGTAQTVTCTIRDPAQQTATDTATVTVFAPLQNHAPVACYTADSTAPVGGTVEFDAGACTSDPTGDGSCSFANNRLYYRWDYDNGEGETEELNVCSMLCLPSPQAIAPSIGTGSSGNATSTLLGEFEQRGGWIAFTLGSGSLASTDAQDPNSTTIYGWAATIQASGGPLAARRKILRHFEIQDLADIRTGAWTPAAYDGFVYGHVDDEAAQVTALIAAGKRHFRYFTVQEYPLSTWHDTWFDWLRNTAQSTSGWNARMLSGSLVGLYYALCDSGTGEYREFIDWSQITSTRADAIAQKMWDLSPDCIFLDQCWVWGPSGSIFATQGGSGPCGPYQNASGQGAANYSAFPTSKWDTYRDNIMYFYKKLADMGRARGKYVLFNTNVNLAADSPGDPTKGIPPQPWYLERAASGSVIESVRRGMWYDRRVAKYFPAAGTYDVQLRVIEPAPCGLQDTFSQPLVVSDAPPPNEPPVAVLTGPTQLTVNTDYTFDASGSSDPETPVSGMYYRYNWGDGQTTGPTINLRSMSHRYTTNNQNYTIVLTVYDGDPSNPNTLTDSDSHSVTVGTPAGYNCSCRDCKDLITSTGSGAWTGWCTDGGSLSTSPEGYMLLGYNTQAARGNLSFNPNCCGQFGASFSNPNSHTRRVRFDAKMSSSWNSNGSSGLSGQHFFQFGASPIRTYSGVIQPESIRIDFRNHADANGFRDGLGMVVYSRNNGVRNDEITSSLRGQANLFPTDAWVTVEIEGNYSPSAGRIWGYVKYTHSSYGTITKGYDDTWTGQPGPTGQPTDWRNIDFYIGSIVSWGNVDKSGRPTSGYCTIRNFQILV